MQKNKSCTQLVCAPPPLLTTLLFPRWVISRFCRWAHLFGWHMFETEEAEEGDTAAAAAAADGAGAGAAAPRIPLGSIHPSQASATSRMPRFSMFTTRAQSPNPAGAALPRKDGVAGIAAAGAGALCTPCGRFHTSHASAASCMLGFSTSTIRAQATYPSGTPAFVGSAAPHGFAR